MGETVILSGGFPGWGLGQGLCPHRSLFTTREGLWPHFADKEAEALRSEWPLAAPSHPGPRGSLSETGARLCGASWALHPLSSQAGRWGGMHGTAACPTLTPRPVPRGMELQEMLSGRSHFPQGQLRLHYCPQRFQEITALQQLLPAPRPRLKG